jgi:hypothetical protein
MTSASTGAALGRIATCAGLDIHLGDSPGEEPLTTQPARVGRSSLTAWDVNRPDWAGPVEEIRKAGFLELVELAAAVGYVDLSGWEGTPMLARAAGAVAESLGAVTIEEPRLATVRRLATRLSGDSIAVAPRDPVRYGTFESYLALTRSVFHDAALIEALHFTHEGWRPAADRAALLTPRNLADALATGRVGAVTARGVAGMPRSLDAYEWLTAIVGRVTDDAELREGMLANARWSYGAWVARERADAWAVAMSEWSPRRDAEGESRWEEFRERVFRPLERWQRRLDLDTTTNADAARDLVTFSPVAWSTEVALDRVEARLEELLGEGREEAARRTLRRVIARLSGRVAGGADDQARIDAAERLVGLAYRLAELGDPDSAAAFVAPHLELLIEKVGRGYTMTDQALELVARARRLAPAEPSAEEERRSYRARGETA